MTSIVQPGTTPPSPPAAPSPPSKLKRYKDLALLFFKFGRSDVLKQTGLDAELEPQDEGPRTAPEAEELTATLERMGPTFIKLGQVLSTRSDLLPPAYLEALSRLQDNVQPITYAEVEQVVTEELGVRISKAFAEFEIEPLASASLAPVHRAALRDGRVVAGKVQRPGVREQVADDIAVLEKVAAALDKHTTAGKQYGFAGIIEEFKRSLVVELDYRKEAANLARLAANLAEFELIVVPRPVAGYSTGRVLTMDYVEGTKITDVSPLALQELDGERLVEAIFDAYLKQVFVDGFFHADPHPGNVFLTYAAPRSPDLSEAHSARIALLDVGMVARVSPRLQQHLLQLISAISEGQSDEVVDVGLRIAERLEHFDEAGFRRRVTDVVGSHQDASLEEMQIGRTFMTLASAAGETGVRFPQELTMLGKALLNLDLIGRTLAPTFDPNAAIRAKAATLLNRTLLKSLTTGNLLGAVIETKDLVTRLPSRLNRLLDAAADNKLGLKIDTGIDAAQLLVALQKVANRVAVGLVLAALIVGASILMQIPSSFRIFGYPGLGMLFFLFAAGGGVGLLVMTLTRDIHAKWTRKGRG